MFKNILLPTDGSELATRAVDRGIALAKAVGAKVTVLTVVEHFKVFTTNPVLLKASIQEYRKQAAEHGQKVLGEASAKAEAAGVAVATMSRTGDVAWEQIVAAAAESGADCRDGLTRTQRAVGADAGEPDVAGAGAFQGAGAGAALSGGSHKRNLQGVTQAELPGANTRYRRSPWPLRLNGQARTCLVAHYGIVAQHVDERSIRRQHLHLRRHPRQKRGAVFDHRRAGSCHVSIRTPIPQAVSKLVTITRTTSRGLQHLR